jgi:glycosyltransferase involved in cell wall biosynthesis
MSVEKKLRIGFDLDGVIIGKPPLMPKRLIEWLYRGRINKHLAYRYPGNFEKFIRWLSHHYLFRPPIERNIRILRNLHNNKDIELYAVSGRYKFLKGRTKEWLKANHLYRIFKSVKINEADEKSHLFKKRTIVDLKLDYYIEDDPLISRYLKRNLRKVKIVESDNIQEQLKQFSRKRILLGISYYYPNISGLTIYAQNLAEALAAKGYVIEVITSRHLKPLPEHESKRGIIIKRVWTPFIFGRGPIMPSFVYEAYRSVKNADVVNCHIPSFEAVILCVWGKLMGKKVILTHHCDLSNWPGLINQITEKVTYLSLLISGLLANKIVVNTKDYADHSKYLSYFRNKLVYLLPPIKIGKPTGALKKKYKKVNYKIGFVGRMTKEKGITYLLNSIFVFKKSLGNNFKMFLVGPSKEVVGGGDQESINSLIKKYKRYVVHLGTLREDEMADFYQMIDVLVLPSTEHLESFGFVQVEAMKLGCPVVASDMPGVRMPVKLSGMGELVNVKDVNDLSDKVIKVLTNKRTYVKAKKDIVGVFNYSKTIDTYEKLFNTK